MRALNVEQRQKLTIGPPLPAGVLWLLRVGIAVAIGLAAGMAAIMGLSVPLAALMVLLIGALLLLLGWPMSGFALLTIAALFTRYKVEVGVFSLRAEYVAVAVVGLLGLWQMLWFRRRFILTKPGALALGWLLVNLVASLVHAEQPDDSLRHTLRLFLVVLNFIWVVNLLQKPMLWRQAFRRFLLFGIACAGFGVLAVVVFYAFQVNLGVQRTIYLPQPVPYGTFEEGNLLGSHSASWLLALLCLFLSGDRRQRWRRLWVIIGIGVTGLAVILSLSRGAWLGLAVGLLLVFIFYGRDGRGQRQRSLYVMIALPIFFAWLATALMFLPDSIPLVGRLRTFTSITDDPTAGGRLQDIPVALADWAAHPLIGWGPGTFFQIHGHLRGSPAWIWNLTLRTLQEAGLVGLLLFGGYLLGASVMAIRTMHRVQSDDDRAMLLGLLIGLAALTVSYQSTDGTWLAAPWLHSGLMVAGARALAQSSKPTMAPTAQDSNKTAMP